jgi:hypothetical protein
VVNFIAFTLHVQNNWFGLALDVAVQIVVVS